MLAATLAPLLAAFQEKKDIAFLADFVKEQGYWALTAICLIPMFAFIGYVIVHDARAAKAHKPH